MTRGLLLAGVVGLPLAAVWGVWRGPIADPDGAAAVAEWLSSPLFRPLRGLPVAAGVLIWLWLLLAAAGARRRPAWAAAFLLSVLCWFGFVFAWPRRYLEPRGLDRFSVIQWGYAEPSGPLAAATTDRALGWRWVGTLLHWRQALLVQPPCRVSLSPAVPSGDAVRLFVALPEQTVNPGDQSVRVRCSLTDRGGRVLATEIRRLVVSLIHWRREWTEMVLPVPRGSADDLTLTVEAEALDPDGTGVSPVVLALAADREVPPEPGPNCVLILVNSLRADRLACYGFSQPTSPASTGWRRPGRSSSASRAPPRGRCPR